MISTKIELIKENSKAALVALDAQIKTTENLIKNKAFLEIDDNRSKLYEKVETSLREDLVNEQNVRNKIKKNDFNLSLFEINIVALAFFYQEKVFEKQKQTLETLISKTNTLFQQLTEEEEVN